MFWQRYLTAIALPVLLTACDNFHPDDPGCPGIGQPCTEAMNKFGQRCWHKLTITGEDKNTGMLKAKVAESVYKETIEKERDEDTRRKPHQDNEGKGWDIRIERGTTRDKNGRPVEGPPKIGNTYLMAQICPTSPTDMVLVKEVEDSY
jgi:hypothetical protein